MPSFGWAFLLPVRNTSRYRPIKRIRNTDRYRAGRTGGDDDATVLSSPRARFVYPGRAYVLPGCSQSLVIRPGLAAASVSVTSWLSSSSSRSGSVGGGLRHLVP